jgi:predicted metal-dependent enzyme (double-stranded beta helix superfamily)
METTSADSRAWPWPDTLDALYAAPGHHQLLFENDHVRVLDVRIGPGQLVPIHTHRWPSVVFVKSAGDVIRRDGQGELLADSRKASSFEQARAIMWLGPIPPHSVENVGVSEIHLVTIEVKQLAG